MSIMTTTQSDSRIDPAHGIEEPLPGMSVATIREQAEARLSSLNEHLEAELRAKRALMARIARLRLDIVETQRFLNATKPRSSRKKA